MPELPDVEVFRRYFQSCCLGRQVREIRIPVQAGIHPAVPAGRLGEESLRGIYSVLQQVLEWAVESGAEPGRMPQDFLLPRRDDPEGKCPSCGRPLRKQKISGRPAVFCPSCQQ